jgi:hypothetical protein
MICIQPIYWFFGPTTENTAFSIAACWTVFTELLPTDWFIQSVTIINSILKSNPEIHVNIWKEIIYTANYDGTKVLPI